jgi:hypothetical protein
MIDKFTDLQIYRFTDLRLRRREKREERREKREERRHKYK